MHHDPVPNAVQSNDLEGVASSPGVPMVLSLVCPIAERMNAVSDLITALRYTAGFLIVFNGPPKVVAWLLIEAHKEWKLFQGFAGLRGKPCTARKRLPKG